MRLFTMPLLAIVTAAAVVGMVTVGLQQAYAPRDCPGCMPQFKKLTNEFEKAVIGLVGNPNELPPSPAVSELHRVYTDGALRIFLGGPDTIPVLLEDYQQEVLSLLSAPPDPDKQHPGIAFMQNFRKLTHDFEKAVLDAFPPGH
jgi:hypothetical protein